MNTLRIQSLKAVRAEMTAVASGEKDVPTDASQISLESEAALPAIVQRAEPNVSRPPSKFVDAGFVTMQDDKGKAKMPK